MMAQQMAVLLFVMIIQPRIYVSKYFTVKIMELAKPGISHFNKPVASILLFSIATIAIIRSSWR